jgi:hypothetical protein
MRGLLYLEIRMQSVFMACRLKATPRFPGFRYALPWAKRLSPLRGSDPLQRRDRNIHTGMQ